MEDEAYARELFAILTNPSPTGIDPDDPYGRADDGLDRHDGFGRDVWVESVDVTDGEHGAEIVVRFGLAVPPDPIWQGMSNRGSVHLPFDKRWRRLSGYEVPAAYAPTIAQKVELAAYEMVERHRSGAHGRGQMAGTSSVLSSRDEQWRLLLEALSVEGTVRELGPGRVELDMHDAEDQPSGDLVTVVVSPEQWEHVLAERAGGDVDLYVAELLGPRDDDERFVVCYDGDLARSTREELPPVRGRARERKLAQARTKHPDSQGGWFAVTGPGDEPTPSND
jgi:hypothetical protein